LLVLLNMLGGCSATKGARGLTVSLIQIVSFGGGGL
jgi:hypothetical protein